MSLGGAKEEEEEVDRASDGERERERDIYIETDVRSHKAVGGRQRGPGKKSKAKFFF